MLELSVMFLCVRVDMCGCACVLRFSQELNQMGRKLIVSYNNEQ